MSEATERINMNQITKRLSEVDREMEKLRQESELLSSQKEALLKFPGITVPTGGGSLLVAPDGLLKNRLLVRFPTWLGGDAVFEVTHDEAALLAKAMTDMIAMNKEDDSEDQ